MDGAGASGPYPAVAGSRRGAREGRERAARVGVGEEGGSGEEGVSLSLSRSLPFSSPHPAGRRKLSPRGRYAATSRRAAAVSLEA